MTHCGKAHQTQGLNLVKLQSYKGNDDSAKADSRSCCFDTSGLQLVDDCGM